MFSQIIKSIIQEFTLPSLAIGVIQNNRVVFKETYGICSHTHNIAVTEHTLFQIASLSKGFLGILIAKLVDEKTLKWENEIANLTLRQIACMQTGLKENFAKNHLSNMYSKNTLTQIVNKEATESKREKLEQFTYQYALLILVEEIIRQKTGDEWEQLLYDKLLRPLELYNTGIDITQMAKSSKVFAKPHDINNKEIELETFQVNSAAGMYSNLNDMLTWLDFHLQGGRYKRQQIVSEAEIKKIYQANTAVPIKDFKDDLKGLVSASYGYFWYNFCLKLGNKILTLIEHNGECQGMSSLICYLPEEHVGIVILSNKQTIGLKKLRTKLLEYIFYR